MVKQDVQGDRKNYHGRQRDKTAGHKCKAANQFRDLQERHEITRRHDAVHKQLGIAFHLRVRHEVEKDDNGGEQEHQPHQGADNDDCDFHIVMFYPFAR